MNSIKVYQLEDAVPIEQQAPINANLTGSPGPINAITPEVTKAGAAARLVGRWDVAVVVVLAYSVSAYICIE
jgi:hypothetical protein